MAYSSTFSSFNYPNPTDRLNNPSHSALHNTVSSAIGQIQAVIGLADSGSVVGTIIGDLRSPDSNGGGHVQTANKGGTGQTNFNKGDLLVGQSSSVLVKFAVGNDAQFLTADSSQAVGVKWVNSPTGSKLSINPSTITISSTVSEAALASASVTGSIMGDSNGIRFTIPTVINTGRAATSTNLGLWYGLNRVVQFTLPNPGNNTTLTGMIDGMIIGGGSSSTQSAYLRAFLPGTTSLVGFATGTSSINSTVLQQLQIRATNTDTNSFVQATFAEFDKIV